jgi:hypothetical protein
MVPIEQKDWTEDRASKLRQHHPLDSTKKLKSVPCAPLSHPFVERLIGTIRREYFDQIFFWNAADLARKLNDYKIYYKRQQPHQTAPIEITSGFIEVTSTAWRLISRLPSWR